MTGLKKLYFRNINNKNTANLSNSNRPIISLDDVLMVYNHQQKNVTNIRNINVDDVNVQEILYQDIKENLNVNVKENEKKIIINTIKNINNRLYLLE